MFLNDEWTVNKRLLINAGGMAENDVMGYGRFSPHASFNFHLDPQQTLRLGVAWERYNMHSAPGADTGVRPPVRLN